MHARMDGNAISAGLAGAVAQTSEYCCTTHAVPDSITSLTVCLQVQQSNPVLLSMSFGPAAALHSTLFPLECAAVADVPVCPFVLLLFAPSQAILVAVAQDASKLRSLVAPSSLFAHLLRVVLRPEEQAKPRPSHSLGKHHVAKTQLSRRSASIEPTAVVALR